MLGRGGEALQVVSPSTPAGAAPGQLGGRPGPRATFWTRRTASIHRHSSEAPQKASDAPGHRASPLPPSMPQGARQRARGCFYPQNPRSPCPSCNPPPLLTPHIWGDGWGASFKCKSTCS